MVKLAKVLLILAVIAVVIGGLARLAGFHNENVIPTLNIAPQALWRLSLSLTGFSAAFCLLDLAGRKKDNE